MPPKSFAEKSQDLLRQNKPDRLDKFDRIRAYWLGEIELSDQELEMLGKYRTAFSIYCTDNSKAVTLQSMTKELKLSEPQCYVILRDAIKLYGQGLNHDKAGERIASREQYLKIAKLAEKEGDYQTAYKARVQADKIIGLYEADEARIPSAILLPPTTFVFTSDPEVLREQQTEDTDHEVIE